MKLPIKSIKEYLRSDLQFPELLKIVSTKIGSVEGYTDYSKMYNGIYVAQIVVKKDHPDAEKLCVYDISTGDSEFIQVVAGDKDLNVGDKVAYIKPGYIVPSTYQTSNEFKIKAVNMRGILSNGMLCSEKELNIGNDHTKVLVLDPEARVGKSFSEYYQLDDTVVDIENKALTNRGDLFGILGLVREISGALNLPFKSPDWYTKTDIDISVEDIGLELEISNEAQSICPRYMAVCMSNIKVMDSPVWLKSILIKSGFKPINNVVDVTNYLAILTGQPLHAFDYDKVMHNDPNVNDMVKITVRTARDGERIHTLDDNIVELNSNHLVIADSTNPIAIAGVIGGKDTEIDQNTHNIIIESANFNRFSIRKTSMELGIFTEAVTRYTKGQDPQLCLPIILKAVELIKDLSLGEISSDIKDSYPDQQGNKEVTLSINKLNSLLGTNLSKDEVSNILSNIEYHINPYEKTDEYITVRPPIFRTDIYIPEDIYEDVGRIYGYENILLKLPQRDIRASRINRNVQIKNDIRYILSNSGCNEVDTYSFTSMKNFKNAKQDPNIAFHIKNAQSPDLELMRTSLLLTLLEKSQLNIQNNILTFSLFEFNIPHIKGYTDNFQLPKEDWHLSLLFSSRESLIEGNPYYQVKKYFEKIAHNLGLTQLEYTLLADISELDLPLWIKSLIPTFNPNSTAVVTINQNEKKLFLGILGDINQDVKDNYKLPSYTSGMEINIDELLKHTSIKTDTSINSKYPSISQDLCLELPEKTKYEEIENLIGQIIDTRDRHCRIECLDIYQKDPEKKNITVRITIEHISKTLTDKEFEKLTTRIRERLKFFNE